MTLEYVNHLQCDNIPCPRGSLESAFHHFFLTRAPISTSVPWIELGRTCSHFLGSMQTLFGVALLCPINVVEQRHEHDLFIEILWISPIQVLLEMLLDVSIVWAPGNQMNAKFCFRQIHVRSIDPPILLLPSVFLSDGSGFDTLTRTVWNMRTRELSS